MLAAIVILNRRAAMYAHIHNFQPTRVIHNRRRRRHRTRSRTRVLPQRRTIVIVRA